MLYSGFRVRIIKHLSNVFPRLAATTLALVPIQEVPYELNTSGTNTTNMQVFHVPDQNYHLRNLGFEPGLSQEEGDKNFAEFLSRSESKFAGAEILKAFLNTPLSLKSDPKFIYYAYGHRPEEYQTAKIVGDLHGQLDQWQLGDYKNYILKKFNDEVKGFSLEEKSFFADRLRSILRHKIRLVQSGEADATSLGEDGLRQLADRYANGTRRNFVRGTVAAGLGGLIAGGTNVLTNSSREEAPLGVKVLDPDFHLPPTKLSHLDSRLYSNISEDLGLFVNSLLKFLKNKNISVVADPILAITKSIVGSSASPHKIVIAGPNTILSARLVQDAYRDSLDRKKTGAKTPVSDLFLSYLNTLDHKDQLVIKSSSSKV
jgi:hypothetical protein